MGIPGFFRWVESKYPRSVHAAEPVRPSNCHNLYLDLNGYLSLNVSRIIHEVCGEMGDASDPVRRAAILHRIDTIIELVAPQMVQPLKPRSVNKDNVVFWQPQVVSLIIVRSGPGEKHSSYGERIQGDIWSPASTRRIKKWCSFSLTTRLGFYPERHKNYRNLEIFVDDANVPGEGEHKIICFIRAIRTGSSYNPLTTHVMYGLDADFILLGLATHELNFKILRQEFVRGKRTENLIYCDLGILRACLEQDMGELITKIQIQEAQQSEKSEVKCEEDLTVDLKEKGDIYFERLLDDFIFILSLIGNDFLPHTPGFTIQTGAIDTLMTEYKQHFFSWDGYLIGKMGNINFEGLLEFFKRLSKGSDAFFRRNHYIKQKVILSHVNRTMLHKLDYYKENLIFPREEPDYKIDMMNKDKIKKLNFKLLSQQCLGKQDIYQRINEVQKQILAYFSPNNMESDLFLHTNLVFFNDWIPIFVIFAFEKIYTLCNSDVKLLELALSGLPSAHFKLDKDCRFLYVDPAYSKPGFNYTKYNIHPAFCDARIPIPYDPEVMHPAAFRYIPEPSLSVESAIKSTLRHYDSFFYQDPIQIGGRGDYRGRYYAIAFSEYLLMSRLAVSSENKDREKGSRELVPFEKMKRQVFVNTVSKQASMKFVLGLQWVSKYYLVGLPNWSFTYPYRHSPFLEDIVRFLELWVQYSKSSKKPEQLEFAPEELQLVTSFEKQVQFSDGKKPWTPFQQLMAILPPVKIQKYLPDAYYKLTKWNSRLFPYYPLSFGFYQYGIFYADRRLPLIPNIQPSVIQEVEELLYSSGYKLSSEQSLRNQFHEIEIYRKYTDTLDTLCDSKYSFDLNSLEQPLFSFPNGILWEGKTSKSVVYHLKVFQAKYRLAAFNYEPKLVFAAENLSAEANPLKIEDIHRMYSQDRYGTWESYVEIMKKKGRRYKRIWPPLRKRSSRIFTMDTKMCANAASGLCSRRHNCSQVHVYLADINRASDKYLLRRLFAESYVVDSKMYCYYLVTIRGRACGGCRIRILDLMEYTIRIEVIVTQKDLPTEIAQNFVESLLYLVHEHSLHFRVKSIQIVTKPNVLVEVYEKLGYVQVPFELVDIPSQAKKEETVQMSDVLVLERGFGLEMI